MAPALTIASLLVLDGPEVGRRHPMRPTLLIGRGPYNHVLLDDSRVSRQHAKISAEPGGYVLYDLNSSNGTFVNGAQVERRLLAANDEIHIGPFTLRCVGEQRQSHSPPSIEAMQPRESQARITRELNVTQVLGDPGPQPRVAGGLTELEEAQWRFRTLQAFVQSIAGAIDSSDAIDLIAGSLLDAFPSARTVALSLREAGSGDLAAPVVRSRLAAPPDEIAIPPRVHREALTGGRSLLVEAPGGGGPSMYAPLLRHGIADGLILIEGDESAAFVQLDLDLLLSMAATAATTLQGARLHGESLKQQRLQLDLKFAEEIQHSFLPREFPRVDGIEFAAEYRPAFAVGGDFFDLFWADERRIGIVIGDVSGKGVSAALLMARISSDLRIAASTATDPGQALATVNTALLARRQDDIFFTGIYLTLDIASGEVVLASAGHLPPLVKRRGTGALQEIVDGIGPAAGILPGTSYRATRFTLDPGDVLVLYTDGVSEATDGDGQQFGTPRLVRSLAGGAARPVELAARVMSDLKLFCRRIQQTDDITLVLCGLDERVAVRKRREGGVPIRWPAAAAAAPDVTQSMRRLPKME